MRGPWLANFLRGLNADQRDQMEVRRPEAWTRECILGLWGPIFIVQGRFGFPFLDQSANLNHTFEYSC